MSQTSSGDDVTSTGTSTRPDGGQQTITSFEVVTDAMHVLTTIFTPPSDCKRGVWTSNTSDYGALFCTKQYTSSCFPSNYYTEADVLFSPGVCPDGYFPGPTFSATDSTEVQSCVCCPESLTFNPGAKTCQGLITDATAIVESNRTTRLTGSFTAIARLVLVAWEDRDLSSFSPLSAPLFQAAASTTPPASNTTDTSPTNGPTAGSVAIDLPADSGGMGLGVKIGVGVGVGCGVLLLCTLTGIIAIYRRRLRRLRETASTKLPATDSSASGGDAKAELGGDSHVVEIGGRDLLAEADGNDTRHELEGGWHGYEARGA